MTDATVVLQGLVNLTNAALQASATEAVETKLSDQDQAALKLLDKLTVAQRRDIVRFVDANRHQTGVTPLTYMQWCAECMELMTPTCLQNAEKRALVVALYHQMSASDCNNFDDQFNIEAAVEFVWDNNNGRYGIKVNKTGCFSWLPCCKSVQVDYNTKTGKSEVVMTPLNSSIAPVVITSPRGGK